MNRVSLLRRLAVLCVALSCGFVTAEPPPDLLRLAYEGGSAVEIAEAKAAALDDDSGEQWQRGGGSGNMRKKDNSKVGLVIAIGGFE